MTILSAESRWTPPRVRAASKPGCTRPCAGTDFSAVISDEEPRPPRGVHPPSLRLSRQVFAGCSVSRVGMLHGWGMLGAGGAGTAAVWRRVGSDDMPGLCVPL